jgi:hypothetical protein
MLADGSAQFALAINAATSNTPIVAPSINKNVSPFPQPRGRKTIALSKTQSLTRGTDLPAHREKESTLPNLRNLALPINAAASNTPIVAPSINKTVFLFSQPQPVHHWWFNIII